MYDVLDSAEHLRKDAKECSFLMDTLDRGTNESMTIFKKISDGNISNAMSVEKQAEMTANITEMINKVVVDANNAMLTTKQSLAGIFEGRKR